MIKRVSMFLVMCIMNLSLIECSLAMTEHDIQVKHWTNEHIMIEAPSSVMANDEFIVRVNEASFKDIEFAPGIIKVKEWSEKGYKIFSLKAPNEHGNYFMNIDTKDGKRFMDNIEVKSYLNEFIYGSAKVAGFMVLGVAVVIALLSSLTRH